MTPKVALRAICCGWIRSTVPSPDDHSSTVRRRGLCYLAGGCTHDAYISPFGKLPWLSFLASTLLPLPSIRTPAAFYEACLDGVVAMVFNHSRREEGTSVASLLLELGGSLSRPHIFCIGPVAHPSHRLQLSFGYAGAP